jgi:hypothetical protein
MGIEKGNPKGNTLGTLWEKSMFEVGAKVRFRGSVWCVTECRTIIYMWPPQDPTHIHVVPLYYVSLSGKEVMTRQKYLDELSCEDCSYVIDQKCHCPTSPYHASAVADVEGCVKWTNFGYAFNEVLGPGDAL